MNRAKRPCRAIGVDLGGTKIAAGIVRFPEGRPERIRRVPTQAGRGAAAVLKDIEELVAELGEQARHEGAPVDVIGIGVCELVDRQGQIASAHTLPIRTDDLVSCLTPWGPVTIEADVRASAVAEAWFGAGKGVPAFLYVSVGTGISSCLVVDGAPYLGARGATGTLASGPLFDPFRSRFRPRLRSLEEISSGPALSRRYESGSGAAKTPEAVLVAAAKGDAHAIEVVRSAGRALGAAVGLLINVLDPERVLLGGGLGLEEGLYRESLVEAAREAIWWNGHRNLPIVAAGTGEAAGVLGAATAAWLMRGSGARKKPRDARGRM